MNQPTEQEISDKRDEAAEKTSGDATSQYAEGVRDALAWVLGDMEDGLEL